jgi:hypothetical protein
MARLIGSDRTTRRTPILDFGGFTPIQEFDFTTLATGVGSLPAWLLYTRAGAMTPDTSASSFGAALATDEAPISDIGYGSRLRFEASRASGILYSTDLTQAASWNALDTGVTRTAGRTGPNGVANAYRFEVPSSKFGLNDSAVVGSGGAIQTTSIWLKSNAGASVTGNNLYKWVLTTRAFDNSVFPTTWSRGQITTSDPTGTVIQFIDGRDWTASGGVAAGARDFDVTAPSREMGQFPTSYIPTSGAYVTRSGARLRHVSPSSVLISGRFEGTMFLQPLGAYNEYTADGTSVYIARSTDNPTDTWIRVNTTTLRVTVSTAGVLWTPSVPLPNWARYAPLAISWAVGGGVLVSRLAYALNEGAWVAMGESAEPQPAWVAPTSIDLLCAGTSNQFSCDLKKPQFWRPGESQASIVSAGAAYDIGAELDLAGWFDADAAYVTDVGAGVTSAWRARAGDVVGVAQSAAGSRAVYGATVVNGYPGITFDGTNDFFESTTENLTTAGGVATIVTVGKSSNAVGGAIISRRVSNQYQAALMLVQGGQSYMCGDGVNISASGILTTSMVPEMQSNFCATHIFNGTGNAYGYRLNSVAKAFTQGIQTAETGTTGYQIGRSSFGQYWPGPLASIVFIRRVLTGARILVIENYLRAQRGL